MKLLLFLIGLGGLAIALVLANRSREAPAGDVGSKTEPVKKKDSSSTLLLGVAVSSAACAAAAAAAAKKKKEAKEGNNL